MSNIFTFVVILSAVERKTAKKEKTATQASSKTASQQTLTSSKETTPQKDATPKVKKPKETQVPFFGTLLISPFSHF